MHDHTYRMGICWQNTAYNQPPHLGYYLPDYIDGKLPSAIHTVVDSSNNTSEEIFDLNGRRRPALQKGLNIVRKNGKTYKVIRN
jgi:rhamnogalacturonan endolyase